MKIEIACKNDESNKQKGDLLEKLSKKLLEAQGYTVIEEIRIVGAELDLLCKHKVSGKNICRMQGSKKSNFCPYTQTIMGYC